MTEQALKKGTKSHPYIVINKDVCDGSPVIEGTRTRVIDIAIEYELLGRSPSEFTPKFKNTCECSYPRRHDQPY